jgi:hypothetical protein
MGNRQAQDIERALGRQRSDSSLIIANSVDYIGIGILRLTPVVGTIYSFYAFQKARKKNDSNQEKDNSDQEII